MFEEEIRTMANRLAVTEAYETENKLLNVIVDRYRKALEEIAEGETNHSKCSDECNMRELDPVFIAKRALEEKP